MRWDTLEVSKEVSTTADLQLEGRPRGCDVGHKKSLLHGVWDPGGSLSRKDTHVRKVGAARADLTREVPREHDQTTGEGRQHVSDIACALLPSLLAVDPKNIREMFFCFSRGESLKK